MRCTLVINLIPVLFCCLFLILGGFMINNVFRNDVLNITVYFTIFGILFLISIFNLFASLCMPSVQNNEIVDV